MKKLMRKLLALVAAMTMVLGMSGLTAFAAGTGTITITPPANTPSDATNTYKIYKVFDADGNGDSISYKLLNGQKTTGDAWVSSKMGDYFEVDSAGNVTAKDAAKDTTDNTKLSAGAVQAIASYVEKASITATTTVTSTGNANATAGNLNNGYYYITTSTGTAVTITSTNPNATVNDKGTVPSVDKKITAVDKGSLDDAGQKAIAQVGSQVSYESDITVPANTKNLKFNDNMGTGLKLDTTTVKVQLDAADVLPKNYNLTTTDSTIDITFTDAYIASLDANAVIKITYKATITSDALTVTAAKNTASITYGDNNAKITSENKPEVYNATITVTKQDGDKKGLAGAGFVLKNAQGQFYKIADGVVSWVVDQSDATEYFSKGNGKLYAGTKTTATDGVVTITYSTTDTADKAFAGLANDTYTLVESTVPAGYNKAADQNFTIAEKDFTEKNLAQSTTVVNEKGSALPSTGGMGTTIFYVLGAALVIGAGVVLVTRRRLSK